MSKTAAHPTILPSGESLVSGGRRVTFRLYPNRQQEKILHYWRRLHCWRYNAAIAQPQPQPSIACYDAQLVYCRFGMPL